MIEGEARERLLNEHFKSLGVALLEIPFAWWSPPEHLANLLRIEGAEHLQAALARGRGAIVIAAHFTSLEMGARALVTVAPVGFLYRPPKNEVIAYAFARFRTAYGGHGIPRGDIRAFISALRHNECVWYAPDQSYRKKGAAMVPLFGIPAASNTVTSRLARLTGAPVLPYFFRRLPGTQGYVGVIHPPLENFPSECAAADTMRFHRMIEAQVRLVPEQYLWIHRRFKGLSADYTNYYGR
jgi:KDO2-lipid IV(A) lauroyltransferase